jgi:hypothetical protein
VAAPTTLDGSCALVLEIRLGAEKAHTRFSSKQAVERRLWDEKSPAETYRWQSPAFRERVGRVATEPKNLPCFFDGEGSPRDYFGAHSAILSRLVLDILCLGRT